MIATGGVSNSGTPAEETDVTETDKSVFESIFSEDPVPIPAPLQAWVSSDKPWRKLEGVAPELRVRVFRIVTAMAVLGYRMMVTDGVRTDAKQQELYRQGRRGRKDEAIVTYANGITERSNHQVWQQDGKWKGLGIAVDMTFCDAAGKPKWDDADPWELYGALAKSLGLEWGGDWPAKKRDRPHIELSRR